MSRLLRTNIFVACFLGCYFVVSFGLGILSVFVPALGSNLLLTNLLVYLFSFGLPALIYVWIVRKNTGEPIRQQLGLIPISAIDLLLAVASGLLVQPLMMLISSLSQLVFQNVTTSSLVEMAQMPLWAMLLTVGFFPAFFEELVCRGIIFRGHRDTPLWYQLLLPALFFGLLHLNFQQAIYATVAGIFMALLVRFTGSLWSSIAAHLTVNGLQSFMTWALTHADGYDELLAEASTALPTGGTGLLLTLLPYLMLTALTLPLLVLCMLKLLQRGRARQAMQGRAAANGTATPHWHRGAWPMYVVLGFLLVFTLLTELMLYFAI